MQGIAIVRAIFDGKGFASDLGELVGGDTSHDDPDAPGDFDTGDWLEELS